MNNRKPPRDRHTTPRWHKPREQARAKRKPPRVNFNKMLELVFISEGSPLCN